MREFADVVFPAEAYPEKEGTLVHPDGRVQRLRPAIGRPRGAGGTPGSGVRPLWQVIADVAKTLGFETGNFRIGAQVSRRLFETVPFYAGLTLEEIGGRGVRWVEREEFVSPDWEAAKLEIPQAAPAAADGKLRLGTYRPLWAAKEVDLSPALQFIRARQVAELSPADAAALGINEGDRVEVGNGSRVRAQVKLRDAIPAGSVFLAEGTREDNANVLTHALVEITRDRRRLARAQRRPAQVQPAVEGLAEMPPSAGCRSRRVRSHDASLGEIGYYEPWWMQILKAIVIFAVVFNLVPLALLADRKVLGRFQHRYGPNRVGPFGALQAIADIGKLVFKAQFRPDGRQRLAVRARPGDLDGHRGGDDRDHPVLGRRRHLRHAGRALRRRPVDRHPVRLRLRRHRLLRPDARRLGLGARSTRSSARCAPPRS